MKIISLNIWGGIVKEPLLEFFRAHAEVDVFLLQEVFYNGTERTTIGYGAQTRQPRIYHEIQDVLSDYQGLFAGVEGDEWGLATFVRRSLSVIRSGDVFVHRWKDAMVGKDGTTLGRNLQYVELVSAHSHMLLCNFHGLFNGNGKTDTDDRLQQSAKILEFINADSSGSPVVLAGDFNLNPDTKSIAMFEKGLRNLIKEYGITSTRTSFYEKENRFADYVFVSSTVEVKDFKVLPDEVSDHAALYLEI